MTTQTHPAHSASQADYNLAPVVVFWEVTKACALACRHCRALAQPKRNPLELTTEEGVRLIDQVASFGNHAILVVTGGDPLMRRDLFDFLNHGIEKGLRVSLSPSVTPLVTSTKLRKAKEAGLSRLSFSLDGSSADIHDGFRQVQGVFDRTMECFRNAKEVGLETQVNTTISKHNINDLERLAELIHELGSVLWDVFFLVPTGRGLRDDVISPEEHERVYNWLYDFSKTSPFTLKTTLGQPFRRVTMQREAAEAASGAPPAMAHYQPGGTNDGKGICFISHTGDVCPSGFLPLVAGNIRETSIVETYRESSIFKELRDSSLLKGKCGCCPYNKVCGGCRARAFAVTGDYLEAEPYCVYQPPPSR